MPPGFVITGILDNQVATENFALFGEMDLPLGDRFTLTFGARFDDERKTDGSIQQITVHPPLFQPPPSRLKCWTRSTTLSYPRWG